MREIRTLRLTWRGLETWPWWNCEPIPQSKERNWKPSTYSRRACGHGYFWFSTAPLDCCSGAGDEYGTRHRGRADTAP